MKRASVVPHRRSAGAGHHGPRAAPNASGRCGRRKHSSSTTRTPSATTAAASAGHAHTATGRQSNESGPELHVRWYSSRLPQHERSCFLNGGPRGDYRPYRRPVVETHMDGHRRLLTYVDGTKTMLAIQQTDDDRPSERSRWEDVGGVGIPTATLIDILKKIGALHD